MRNIDEDQWKDERAGENGDPGAHPCDHYDADKCVCRGKCGCHWVDDEEEVE